MSFFNTVVLEFDKLLKLISEEACSNPGKEKILNLVPDNDFESIKISLRKVTELKELLQSGTSFILTGLKDIKAILVKCKIQGSILEIQDFLDIVGVIRISIKAKKNITGKWEKYSYISKLLSNLENLSELEKKIDKVFNESGEIKDDASGNLVKIRRNWNILRNRLIASLEKLLQSYEKEKITSESTITLRNGRYVIPLRTDKGPKGLGIVHDQSASGATFYIEPFNIIDLNNQLKKFELEEQREIKKILGMLTDEVRANEYFLMNNFEILSELDCIYARSRFSINFKCIEPLLNQENIVKINKGRHPLLEAILKKQDRNLKDLKDLTDNLKRDIIPLDIQLGGENHCLILTGPNAGGKTVALKTVGLLCIMAQSGIHIPVQDGSEIAIFNGIYADIGDEQSIEADLSTFSSHIANIAGIMQTVDDHSLVLLDELGAGTDPEEGANLAKGIIRFLLNKGTLTLATTHLGALKVLPTVFEGVENASMEFSMETLSSTYKLIMGIPGRSFGIPVAQKFGLPDEIVEIAKNSVDNGSQKLESLIVDLYQRQKELEIEKMKLLDLKKMLINENNEISIRKKEILKIEQEYRKGVKAKIENTISKARQEVERVVKELRESKIEKTDIKKAHGSLKEIEFKLVKIVEDVQKEQTTVQNVDPFPSIGEKVYVSSFNFEGYVNEVKKDTGKIRINRGNISIEVDVREIEGSKHENQEIRSPITFSTDIETDENLFKIDIRGCTGEEAWVLVDRFIDRALLNNIQEIQIVHGKGTGRLRKAILEYLNKDKRVETVRLGSWNEGGLGVSMVQLQ